MKESNNEILPVRSIFSFLDGWGKTPERGTDLCAPRSRKVMPMPRTGSRHERRSGVVTRRADYNFAKMSGMLDLSRDEKAKHFLPRWLRDAPT